MATQRSYLVFGFGIILLAVLGGTWVVRYEAGGIRRNVLDWFWAPMLAGSGPVSIQITGWPASGMGTIPVGSAIAVVRAANLLAKKHQWITFSSASQANQQVFQVGPVSSQQLRFALEGGPGNGYVRDREKRTAPWLEHPNLDFAIIDRIVSSPQQGPSLSALAFTQAGLAAACEVVTSDALLRRALQDAQAGWPTRNIQLVMRMEIVNDVARAPEIVALEVQ